MKAACLLALALLAAATLAAQTPCDPTQQDCTVGEAFTFYRRGQIVTAVAQEVVNTNKPTASPDAFSGRLHNSYEDYLNLLSFAISDVDQSEDGNALVVRFNPLREGRNLLGLTLTVAKPTVAASVQQAIPEALRTATVTQLQQGLSDTDDLTWSASYSYATTRCDTTVPSTKRCYGRTPRQYGDFLHAALGPPVAVTDVTGADDLSALFPDDERLMPAKLSRATDRAAALRLIQQLVAAEQASATRVRDAFTSLHLDLLPALIDNQPQISAALSYHTPGDLGGPDETSASFEVHFGRENVNTLRRRCAAMRDQQLTNCLRTQLSMFALNGLSTDKFVFTATYKRSGGYQLSTLPLSTQVEGFMPVDIASNSALSVKAQAGREIGSDVMGEPMRADFSFEGIRNENDGTRTENRWVGTLTLSVPLGENITVPVSITYANKAEFLGDPNERFGAHLGLSYRLPAFGGTP